MNARLASRFAFQDVWIRPAVTPAKCARPIVAFRPPVKATWIARPTSRARGKLWPQGMYDDVNCSGYCVEGLCYSAPGTCYGAVA